MAPSHDRLRVLRILVVALALASPVSIGSAAAATSLELDADAVDNPVGGAGDWDTILGWSAGVPVPPTAPRLAASGLLSEGQGVTTFSSSSHDTGSVASWSWSDGNVQQKFELLDAFAALLPGNELVFGADRYSNGSEIALGVWFLQEAVSATGGTFTGAHSVGDLLVIADLTGGPGSVVPALYRWDPADPTAVDNLVAIPVTLAEAEVVLNGSSACAPWPFSPKFADPCPAECSAGDCFPASSFYEGAIDLDALGLGACFRTVLVSSRDDADPAGTLRDFILGPFDTGPVPAPGTVCANELLCANETGGRAPYTYAWSTGQSTSCIQPPGPGTYTVTVTDANGCSGTGEGTALPPPTAGVGAACPGGPLCANAADGMAPYTYAWSTGQTTGCITPTVAGSYTVTVTDAQGCTTSDTGTIYEPPYPNLVSTCAGETLCADPTTGLPPYSYAWSTGDTTQCIVPGAAGGYTVTVTDARGCTKSQIIGVVNPPQIHLSAYSCGGQVCATVNGSSGPYSFAWSSGETTSCINPASTGIYTLTVTDNLGCTVLDSIEVVLNTLAVEVLIQGDSLCAIPSGGLPPYTYDWSNGSSDSCTSPIGSFSLEVTDSRGCGASTSVVAGTVLAVPGAIPDLQTAIDVAAKGDTVLVAPGTYTGPDNRDLDLLGKEIILRSEGGAAVTVIDCEGQGAGVSMVSGETAITLLDGFTIRNATAGGIVLSGASPRIRNCVVETCTSPGNGGGLRANGGAPEIEDCTFQNNDALGGNGGGAYALSSAVRFLRCRFEGNTATGDGGGGWIQQGSAEVLDCDFESNQAGGNAGGLGTLGIDPDASTLEDSRFLLNTAGGRGGGLLIEGSNGIGPSDLRILGNTATVAGGGASLYGEVVLSFSTVTGNHTDGNGGGIESLSDFIFWSRLRFCTLAANSAGTGGGFSVTNHGLYVDRTVVWGNCADSGPREGEVLVTGSYAQIGCSITDSVQVGGTGYIVWADDLVFQDPEFCAPVACSSAPSLDGDFGLSPTSPGLVTNSPCNFQIGATGSCLLQTGIDPDPLLPAVHRMLTASPNPFRAATRIAFELPGPEPVVLEIFDIGGRRVRTLIDAPRGAGRHAVDWDGRDDLGRGVAAGIYTYRLVTPTFRAARKMVLIR